MSADPLEAAVVEALKHQLGAAVNMLESVVHACPDDTWSQPSSATPFSRLCYHTTFWLDVYLSGDLDGFSPPAPFDRSELDPEGVPARKYTRAEILDYLRHCRRKASDVFAGLGRAGLERRCSIGRVRCTYAELLIYNLRHVQHGVAQLNLLLRTARHQPVPWTIR